MFKHNPSASWQIFTCTCERGTKWVLINPVNRLQIFSVNLVQQDKISHNWTLKFILHGSVLLTPCIHILSMCLHFIHTRLRKFKYCIALACKMVFPHLKCKVIPHIFLSLAIWEIRIFKSCLSHQRWLILCVNNTIILVSVLCSFSRSKHDWKKWQCRRNICLLILLWIRFDSMSLKMSSFDAVKNILLSVLGEIQLGVQNKCFLQQLKHSWFSILQYSWDPWTPVSVNGGFSGVNGFWCDDQTLRDSARCPAWHQHGCTPLTFILTWIFCFYAKHVRVY